MRFLRNTLALASAFVLAASFGGAIFAADSDPAIIDEEYRFQLSPPGDDWHLLTEQQLRGFYSDGLAGAASAGGITGAVIVEHTPGVELEAYAHLLSDTADQEQVVERFEKISFQQREAYRIISVKEHLGVSYRYVQTVFLHQDFAYQLIAWGQQDKVSPVATEVQPFFDAFKLLEGTVTARDSWQPPRDQRGIGWRMRDGRFESVVAGIAVEPAPPWRVATGTELMMMDSEAEVGLVRVDPDVYITLTAERLPAGDRREHEARLYRNLSQTLQDEVSEKRIVLTIDGQKRVFRRFRPETVPMEYLHTVHYVQDYAIQVLAWYFRGHKQQGETALKEALSFIAFQSAEARQLLALELATERDPDNAVGTDFALRGGIYRDFRHGFEWKKPAGFWRAHTGETASAVNPDAQLFFEEPAHGLSGTIAATPLEGIEHARFHRRAVKDWLGESAPAEAFSTDGTEWLVSEVESDHTGWPLRYRIATAAVNGAALEMTLWGQPQDMLDHAATVTAALAGIRFVDGLAATTTRGARFSDYRFGFSLEAPAHWRKQVLTPSEAREIMSNVHWTDGRGNRVEVIALTPLSAGQDEGDFAGIFEQRMRNTLGPENNTAASATDTMFAGIPARRIAWEALDPPGEMYILNRDRTFYVLTLVGDTAAEFERARSSFLLFDDEPGMDRAGNATEETFATRRQAYIQAVRAAITRNWLTPPSAEPGMSCRVKVQQNPGGEILDIAFEAPCNADEATRKSIERAIHRTRSMPYAGFEDVFEREIEFTFSNDG